MISAACVLFYNRTLVNYGIFIALRVAEVFHEPGRRSHVERRERAPYFFTSSRGLKICRVDAFALQAVAMIAPWASGIHPCGMPMKSTASFTGPPRGAPSGQRCLCPRRRITILLAMKSWSSRLPPSGRASKGRVRVAPAHHERRDDVMVLFSALSGNGAFFSTASGCFHRGTSTRLVGRAIMNAVSRQWGRPRVALGTLDMNSSTPSSVSFNAPAPCLCLSTPGRVYFLWTRGGPQDEHLAP